MAAGRDGARAVGRRWRRRLGSLRARVLACLIVALVPGFVLVSYLQADRRDQILAEAHERAGGQAQRVLAEQQDVARAARQVLSVVATVPQMHPPQDAECSAMLATAVSGADEFIQLGVVGLDGWVVCSAVPLVEPVNVSDRAWFRGTVATGEFSVGAYQVGRITKRPTVNFGSPVRDAEGDVVAVAFAAVDLARLIPENLQIPDGGTVLVLDADSMVLASSDSPDRVGTSADTSPLPGLLRGVGDGGEVVAVGLDGVERQWVVRPLGPSTQGALVAAGVSTSMVTAAADRARDQGLVLFVAILVVVGAGGWLLSDVVAVRPLRTLLATTARLRAGDLSARTRLRAAGEIGELARGFDEMADALDARDRQLRDQAELIDHEATHDSLTGLPNRRAFLGHLEQALADARRSGRTVTVLVCGVDNFKVFNDSLGHEAGDGVLVAVGERLGETSAQHPVYRFGGDVFAVLHEGREPHGLADRLLDAARAPMGVYGRKLFLTLSIGMASSVEADLAPDQLLRQADIAMYKAKAHGRDRVERFAPHMLDDLLDRVELEAELRRGIERGELVLHYQPKIDLHSGALIGAESLVRWQHPTRGLVAPDEFIPLAEDTGLILSLGRWALEEATRQAQRWRERSGLGLTIAVNVSTRQLRDPGLEHDVAAALEASGLPPASLILEITESALQESAHALGVLSALDGLGVRLSIDDFGTGYSSLDRLRHFPVHEIKIDKAFVREIATPGDGAPLVVAMIAMAHSLGHNVIAEGVETPDQLTFLRTHGCNQAQGHLVGRPAPNHLFEQLLQLRRVPGP